jgi:hypothetical protein
MTATSDIIFPDDYELEMMAGTEPPTIVIPNALPHVNDRTEEFWPMDARRLANPWPPRLVLDLALGLDDVETILTRHDIPVHTYNQLLQLPLFRRELVVAQKELQENGVSFKRKAALQAEMYLEDMDQVMKDDKTPPSVKKDIFIHMAKLGELEPEKKGDGTNSGPAFNIQINL